MSMDVFGDLRDWGRVLEQLDRLQQDGKLDDHQEGLARLLRYRYNWQIREKAVQSLSALAAPEDGILLLVLDIIADEYTDLKLRTAAANSLVGLIGTRQKSRRWPSDLETTVLEKVKAVLRAHQAPVLKRALQRALDYAAGPLCHKAIA